MEKIKNRIEKIIGLCFVIKKDWDRDIFVYYSPHIEVLTIADCKGSYNKGFEKTFPLQDECTNDLCLNWVSSNSDSNIALNKSDTIECMDKVIKSLNRIDEVYRVLEKEK